MKICPLIVVLVAVSAWSSARAAEQGEWDISKLDASKLPPAAKAKGLTYAKDVKPILEASCFGCHGERRQRGELRLDSLESLLKGGEHGKVVEPRSAAKSKILFAAAQVNDEIAMPPKRGPGGPGGFQPPPELIARFDKDGDGQLNEAERQAMREEFRAQRGGGRGGPGDERPGQGGRGGRGQDARGQGERGQGERGGPGGRGQGQPGGPGGRGGFEPPKPLTAEQVGILRAWIEQGAK